MAAANESESIISLEPTESAAAIDSLAYIGWDSRYFSEGRDNLDGSSLISGGLDIAGEHFGAGVWFGFSPDEDYDELQLSLSLSESVGAFDFYVSYTYLHFEFENSDDNEVGVGTAWSGSPLDIGLAIDFNYSFAANGYFVEVTANKAVEITDQLALDFSVPFGVNQGYVSDGHDGGNYIACSVALEYALSDAISIAAHTSYSWELGSDANLAGDDQLVDFFHAGVGLTWAY